MRAEIVLNVLTYNIKRKVAVRKCAQIPDESWSGEVSGLTLHDTEVIC